MTDAKISEDDNKTTDDEQIAILSENGRTEEATEEDRDEENGSSTDAFCKKKPKRIFDDRLSRGVVVEQELSETLQHRHHIRRDECCVYTES